MGVVFKPMKIGDKGTQIKKAQQLLKKHGSSIKPTDVFGIGMLSAVKSFQRKNKLAVTGIVDKKTWEKLNAEAAGKKKTAKKV